MNSMTKNQVWYGELRSSRGNTVVIYDKDLPEASSGRIYLYNTSRQAIVEYVKDIVENNLHDLDTSSLKKAQDNFTEAWKSAKNKFLEEHNKHVTLEEDVVSIIGTNTSDDEPALDISGSDTVSDTESDSWETGFDDDDV
ncbi:hypothetical protein D5R81_16870 [Parashewanella spongiae]|uniref:Uncharacterized protein n=1 Tax=Parashewanella spongiae TaxID=342950 RepID=A0A3A6TBR2_9GAMM|nr:hypothetical protein [Parashewanella spongiae]MCL1079722.1 hypothetical protein [Parashewanella spongiae]RJY06999.1 hypothetical protein D5R81_16870 [Parashewanella spongiae]